MKKLFMVLCAVIMFFGIVGCPSPDDPATKFGKPNLNSISSTSTTTSGTIGIQPKPILGNNSEGSPVPEPATLILLGSGLIGLAGFGRKKFKR